MRKLLRVIGLSLLLVLSMPNAASAESQATDIVAGKTASERSLGEISLPNISSPHACVVTSEGEVLFERAADEPVYIASITKLMTALTAVDNAELDTVITVDNAAATVGESTSWLQEGDTLTLDVALKALLIPSGNDAAMAIAHSVGTLIDPDSKDPLATFVDAMNQKAENLGLTQTLFSNPHGLDFDAWAGNMHSSANDVVTMIACVMQNETLRGIVAGGSTTITVTSADGTPRDITLNDTNLLVGQNGNIGVKTGQTDDAGYCFAGSWDRNGIEVYTVVLGSASSEERFNDSQALADWAYAHLVQEPLAETTTTYSDGTPILGRAVAADWSDKSIDVTLSEPNATVDVFDLAGPVERTLELDEPTGTVEAGDVVGNLTITQDGTELTSVDVVAAETVREPNILERIMIAFDRVVRWFNGQPQTATEEILIEQ